ncbi:GerAB/ArcD/ProY family transporter [Salinibacillus xinjiangensis]|uniref:GerAB/ArcD/ProY family transporter n=1 Tax=Salinibacillus xinjiangensis TaxID=1229268 RepID=A0A6G1X4D9_9BACI|nr:GerAB/ArcD/ProY family transporter [Salinibacillus xinjiangensis]MRG85698.1 GerAB/ArcD/ProY family transporter [Salinibacillus xinjiangensis]
MGKHVPDYFKISPFLTFFLITAVQVGVGILSFQSIIVEPAGYDAWISIIIASIGVHILIFMMYKILNQEEHKDIFDIQTMLFGKWIGKSLGVITCVYFLLMSFVALRLYIEIIQVWMFPQISLLVVGTVFLLLVLYIINGGFKVIAGICFLGVVIPLYLILTLIFPLEFAYYDNLKPVLNHSVIELLLSAQKMTLSYLGFSTLFVYYPFLKEPKKTQKFAHFGVAFTTFLYVSTAIVSFLFYDEEQIKTVIWPTLGIWKIIEMPFVERFEYIGISSWTLVILPNITLTLWASSRGMKRMFNVNQRKTLIVYAIIIITVMLTVRGFDNIDKISELVTRFGFYYVFVYIPVLCIIHFIFQKVRESK